MIKKLKSLQLGDRSGFTLVEILIVVALIAILAVVALITINPAEAQRRARDTQRVKDMANLQAIMEQFITDEQSAGTLTGFDATSTTATTSPNDCGTGGWTSTDMCRYANVLPVDPTNRTSIYTNSAGEESSGLVSYEIHLNDTAQYRICTRMESRSNSHKLTSDGGAGDNWFEVFSSTTADGCSGT